MRAIRLAALFSTALLWSTACHAATTIWLEAELFDDPGGWTNDAQFIDQMGSPYLLAIGLNGPVKDAVAEVDVPAAGSYGLWVRCRNWIPEHSPGRFQMVLGENTVERVFGRSKKKGWIWERGGTHQLERGKLRVRLRDLTGHYGRCDAIVLSDDPDFRPPEDREKLAEARIRHGGMSRDVRNMGPYDTVVVGGGLAGTFAAVASARMGCRTALVQNRPMLGGNASTEIRVPPGGDLTREPLDPGEGGIIEEVRGPVQGYPERMLKVVRAEPKLDLLLSTHATGVVMKAPDRIEAVTAVNVKTNQRLRLAGTIFIDCTGDGSVGVWAGAEYRHGREPRAMYQESRAPAVGDSHTLGGTLRYASRLRAEPVEFKAPAWARKFPKCDDFGPQRHPQVRFGDWQWVIEYGGVRNTYDDAEEVRDELLRIIWGMWDHAKNHCPRLEKEAARCELSWVSHVVGKRESRRLIGDYVMTEHDVGNQTLFPDRVAYGGWGIDLHPPGGFYDPGPPAEFSHEVKFSVPLRSLYSKNIQNLMMAGRCTSVSHAALGTTRLMITCGLQGQAVGTAAGLCKERNTTPRGLYQRHVGELQQQLLKDGCYLIDLPNEDPGDLARGAAATASSVAPPQNPELLGRLKVHPLGCDRAVMFRVTADRIDRVSLYLHSEKDKPTPVELRLRKAPRLGDFSSTDELATASAVVPAGSEGWVAFELGAKVEPGYYYVWLPRSPGLSWSLFEYRRADTARAFRTGSAWELRPECYAFRLKPPSEALAEAAAKLRPKKEGRKEEMSAAANVVNGFARAIRAWPNSWRPDPRRPLPQWVQLDFGRPVELSCVHVSFQSKVMRAEDFRIDVAHGAEWKTAATVTGNSERRRVIRFDRTGASKLRLVVTKAGEELGVCEIRAYDERSRQGNRQDGRAIDARACRLNGG